MERRVVDLSLLCSQSPRTMAYLQAFADRNIFPKEIVVLKHDTESQDRIFTDLQTENKHHDYTSKYWNPTLLLSDYLAGYPGRILEAETSNPNDQECHKLIRSTSTKTWLFSTSGILSKETPATADHFLHIHPGLVPAYRGSTCFYYSLLQDGYVGTTAFFMEPTLDSGEVLLQKRFKLNVSVKADQRLFVDHIVDPHVRALTLGAILDQLVSGAELRSKMQDELGKCDYYVAHHLIRSLAIRRLNSDFNPNYPVGIFEDNAEA